MCLRHVNEVLSIRRDIHRVMIMWVGQALIVLPVESHAMKLKLHRVFAIARHVIEHARVLIHAHDIRDLKCRVPCDRRDQFPTEFVEIKIRPAIALGSPQEAPSVFEKAHGRRILRPACRPFLTHDDADISCCRVRRTKFHDVLPPVGAMEQQFAIARPRDIIDVVTNYGIIERLPVAHVDAYCFLRRQVVDENVHDGIGRARLGVRLDVRRADDLRLIHLQVKIWHLAFVEAIER